MRCVLGSYFVLLIVSFMSIKGIFFGENEEIQEGIEKKTEVVHIAPLIKSLCSDLALFPAFSLMHIHVLAPSFLSFSLSFLPVST